MTINLDGRSLAYYDVSAHAWDVARGVYRILVGSSSQDIRLHGVVVNRRPCRCWRVNRCRCRMRTNLTFAFDLYELAPPASVWRIHTAVGEHDRRYSGALASIGEHKNPGASSH